jgi:steroid 5-alpha reductase family enzyme
MTSLVAGLAATAALATAAFAALWAASLRQRNASIVDVYWGPGFAAIAALALWLSSERGARSALLLGMVALWGLRLGIHLAWRNRGMGEDPRYAAMRRRYGARFGRVSLVTVFALQAALSWAISLPLQVALLRPGTAALGALDALGVALFATGLGFEAVGDWQLARFRAQPQNRGRVLDRGLWRYTRHPNYFGDSLAWWGMFCVAASTPLGPWTAVSPALMTFLLLRVSGVPLLERSLARTRPGYADYVARTSAFVPLPPRRSPTPGERGASFDRD